LKLGPDESGPPPPATDRDYWEKKASKATVQLADELLGIAREIDKDLEPSYNKHYIGIYKNGQAINFCIFRPKKNDINLKAWVERSDEIDNEIKKTGIEELTYDARTGAYRLALQKDDITKHHDFLKSLMLTAYKYRMS
jgi:hypothetical protein